MRNAQMHRITPSFGVRTSGCKIEYNIYIYVRDVYSTVLYAAVLESTHALWKIDLAW